MNDSTSRKQYARELFAQGYNCSQSVFAALCGSAGLDEGDAKAISAAFGGGIAGEQKVCGAVSGALMILGKQFYTDDDPGEGKKRVYKQVQIFLSRFRELHKSTECADLLGTDMTTAREKNLFKTICPELVADAVDIVEEMLNG